MAVIEIGGCLEKHRVHLSRLLARGHELQHHVSGNLPVARKELVMPCPAPIRVLACSNALDTTELPAAPLTSSIASRSAAAPQQNPEGRANRLMAAFRTTGPKIGTRRRNASASHSAPTACASKGEQEQQQRQRQDREDRVVDQEIGRTGMTTVRLGSF